MHKQLGCRIVPQGNFRTIHSKHAGAATRRHPGGNHFIPGEKAKLHQPPGQVLRKVQSIEDASLADPQFR
jgi:hypothetical protein